MHRTIYPKSARIRSWELFFKLKIIILNLFIRVKKIILSDLIVKLYMFEIKVVRNILLNNIDFYDKPSRMYRSPPRSRGDGLAAPDDII